MSPIYPSYLCEPVGKASHARRFYIVGWSVFPRTFYFWLLRTIVRRGWDLRLCADVLAAVSGRDDDGGPSDDLTRRLAVLLRLWLAMLAAVSARMRPRQDERPSVFTRPPGGQTDSFAPVC